MNEINKKKWNDWVNRCPAATWQNLNGKWMAFTNHKDFIIWLKNIPIVNKRKKKLFKSTASSIEYNQNLRYIDR